MSVRIPAVLVPATTGINMQPTEPASCLWRGVRRRHKLAKDAASPQMRRGDSSAGGSLRRAESGAGGSLRRGDGSPSSAHVEEGGAAMGKSALQRPEEGVSQAVYHRALQPQPPAGSCRCDGPSWPVIPVLLGCHLFLGQGSPAAAPCTYSLLRKLPPVSSPACIRKRCPLPVSGGREGGR